MPLTVNQGFEEFLERLKPTDVERAAAASHRASVKAALEAQLRVGGFFETGSFIHGTAIRSLSHVDVIVRLEGAKPESSYTALELVKDALAMRFPLTDVIVRRPAVAVRFGDEAETWEVIPAFITTKRGTTRLVYDIPGPSAGSAWIPSAPYEHLAYVDECNEKPRKGAAKSLARLIKAWKYYLDVPISSFYLEMRCAQRVASQSVYTHVFDVCLLLESLARHELAAMNDPTRACGRIHACSSESNRLDALAKLRSATRTARKALNANAAGDLTTAFSYLDLLFGGRFPAR
jgi:hypothetical protein